MKLGIGEFSKVTGLPVKTLRFCHERGLLVPVSVDGETGYLFYDAGNAERARVIVALRGLEFSLEEIGELLGEDDGGDVLEQLEAKRAEVGEKVKRLRDVEGELRRIVENEREARLVKIDGAVEERVVPATPVAGMRMKGVYGECGKVFGNLGRACGRHIGGKALSLYYDGEYKEEGADFEPCMPLKRKLTLDGISVRELPEVRCLTVVHRGSYEVIGRSYAAVFSEVEARGLEVELPTREVYLKGPGMIFKGNPDKYVTEIQIPVKEEA